MHVLGMHAPSVEVELCLAFPMHIRIVFYVLEFDFTELV